MACLKYHERKEKESEFLALFLVKEEPMQNCLSAFFIYAPKQGSETNSYTSAPKRTKTRDFYNDQDNLCYSFHYGALYYNW